MPGTEIVRILLERARKSAEPHDRKVSFTLHGVTRNDHAENVAMKTFKERFGVDLECSGNKNGRHFAFVLTAAMQQSAESDFEQPKPQRFIRNYTPKPSFAYAY